MGNDLLCKVESIMGINYWKFDGLPDQITSKLDELMHSYECKELISAMQSLIPKFENDEKELSKYRGNSGMAGEMHMASAMRLKYLNESIDYVKMSSDKVTYRDRTPHC